jgi:divalent metal cation (Fe/Co/Zn/Cd) transporter
VGKASAAQTHADLAPLIADIPAGSATARPPTATDARMGVCVIIAAAAVLGLLMWWQLDNGLAFITAFLALVTVIAGTPITVGLIVDSRHQRRSSGQLPPLPPRGTGE